MLGLASKKRCWKIKFLINISNYLIWTCRVSTVEQTNWCCQVLVLMNQSPLPDQRVWKSLCPGWEGSAATLAAHLWVLEKHRSWRDERRRVVVARKQEDSTEDNCGAYIWSPRSSPLSWERWASDYLCCTMTPDSHHPLIYLHRFFGTFSWESSDKKTVVG